MVDRRIESLVSGPFSLTALTITVTCVRTALLYSFPTHIVVIVTLTIEISRRLNKLVHKQTVKISW